LKRRYYYATKLSDGQGQDKKKEIFSLVFKANESDMPIHISNWFVGIFSSLFGSKDYRKKYDEAKTMAEETPDANFIKELALAPLAESIVEKFRQAYRDWKENSLKTHLDRNTNLDENYMYFPKYMEAIPYICKEESKKLKTKFEELYSAEKQIIVTKVQKQNPQHYMLHYAIETTEEAKPALCELKMWEFKLEPSTYGKIRENANYPVIFPPNPLPKILYIDEAFEIKKICQFDNGKFVLVLWDGEKKRLCYFLRNAFRVERTIQTRFHTISDCIYERANGLVDSRKRFDGTYGYLR